MNDQAFERKVNHDVDALKNDAATLAEDGKTGLDRSANKAVHAVTRAKEDLMAWVGEEGAQVGQKLETLAGSARDTALITAKTVQQDVGTGLNQYNTKIQELSNKVPGGFGEKAARYPWVTITASLVFGFVLGMLLKPSRRPLG